MKENSEGFLTGIDRLVRKSRWLNNLVNGISAKVIPQSVAVGCPGGYVKTKNSGIFCDYTFCEPIPYGGRPCSRLARFRLRYCYNSTCTNYCDAPCPTSGGAPVYQTRVNCAAGTPCPV